MDIKKEIEKLEKDIEDIKKLLELKEKLKELEEKIKDKNTITYRWIWPYYPYLQDYTYIPNTYPSQTWINIPSYSWSTWMSCNDVAGHITA